MRAKYLSLHGRRRRRQAQDVFLGVPSHQMHFGTRVRNYLRQMYKECADEIEAAGLPVVLQFGETQWWYFDNRAAGRAGRDAVTMTRTRSATSRRRRVTRFGRSVSNTDDPAGDPAHPNETADFLRDRIWAYCQDVITYVRAYHPTAVFECLWPLDANQGRRSPAPKFRALNFYVNLPNQWKNSSYGIKYFRCEGFDYDVWQKNADADGADHLVRQHRRWAGRRAECMFLAGLYGPPDPPMAQAYGMWLPLKLYSILLLGVRSVLPELPAGPAGDRGPDAGDRRAVLQAQRHARRRVGDRASRWRSWRAARSIASSATRGSSMSNYPDAIDGAGQLYSPVDAFSTKPLETTATGAIGAGDSTINVPSTIGRLRRHVRHPLHRRRVDRLHRQDRHAVHRLPARRVRDRCRQPRHRRRR